jgi:hypothetical protein
MHVQTDKAQWSTQRYDLRTVIVCNRIDRRIKNKYHTFWAVPKYNRQILERDKVDNKHTGLLERLESAEEAIKNEKSRETGNKDNTRRGNTKHKHK